MLRREWFKVIAILALVALAVALTSYFHFVLGSGTLFTHFFYVPIILAAYWWGRKGTAVALGLVLLLLASDLARGDWDMLWEDAVRSVALLGVALVVAWLREAGLRSEVALRQANKELAKENEARRRAEDSIAVANRKLSLLSKITRHDITNRLTVLEGTLALEGGKQHDPSSLASFERMGSALRSIRRDMEFARDYEEIGTQGPDWQSVPALFEKACLKLGLGPVRAVSEVPGLEVYADHMLVKVFFNLLEDSLQHGGRVTKVRLTSERKGDDLMLIYEDDGVGVPLEEKANLFDMGPGGRGGSGLFLAKEILAITSIDIQEKGPPCQGARFEMLVPKVGFRLR